MDQFEPKENQYYLVKMKKSSNFYRFSGNGFRIATFNGFGSDKGWGGQDWSGDSGHSTDSWMHDEVNWFLPIDEIESMLIVGLKQWNDH